MIMMTLWSHTTLTDVASRPRVLILSVGSLQRHSSPDKPT